MPFSLNGNIEPLRGGDYFDAEKNPYPGGQGVRQLAGYQNDVVVVHGTHPTDHMGAFRLIKPSRR